VEFLITFALIIRAGTHDILQGSNDSALMDRFKILNPTSKDLADLPLCLGDFIPGQLDFPDLAGFIRILEGSLHIIATGEKLTYTIIGLSLFDALYDLEYFLNLS